MKRMISIWLLVLAMLFAFSSSLLSEETPYVPPPSSGSGGEDDGDGHPWGGDDNSTGLPGGGKGIHVQPIIFTGLPGIDFVFFILKQEWILSRISNRPLIVVPIESKPTVFGSQNQQEVPLTIPDRRAATRNNRVRPR